MKKTQSVPQHRIHKTQEQAWRDLSPTKREALLRNLEVGQNLFTKGISIKDAAKQNQFSLLPPLLITYLQTAFNDGRFSKMAQRSHLQSIKSLSDGLDRAERGHESAPD